MADSLFVYLASRSVFHLIPSPFLLPQVTSLFVQSSLIDVPISLSILSVNPQRKANKSKVLKMYDGDLVVDHLL